MILNIAIMPGIPDENAIHGKPQEIVAYYEIDAQGIYRQSRALLDML